MESQSSLAESHLVSQISDKKIIENKNFNLQQILNSMPKSSEILSRVKSLKNYKTECVIPIKQICS